MLSYIPNLDSSDNVKPECNIADFQRGSSYATLNDLLNYANIYTSNVFFGENYFAKDTTFGTYLNNISTTVFNYLLNCKSNIQEQFYNLNIKQKIRSIINNKLVSNTINCINFSVTKLTAKEVHANNISYVSFLNQNANFPVLNSGRFSALNSFRDDKLIFITLSPMYQVTIQNVNKVPIFLCQNNTKEIMHYIPVGVFPSSNLPCFFIIRRM